MINVSIYQGRLVSNPEKKASLNNIFTTFSIAVSRVDGKTADYFDCIAWGKDAENIHKYFFQGDGITVKGRTETNVYVDSDGVKRRSYTLVVESWDFGPKKKGGQENITPSVHKLGGRR